LGQFCNDEQLPVDDWTDQDLLTKQEARERLDAEIGRTQAQLEELRTEKPDAEPEIALLARRLQAMKSIRGEYDAYLDGN
jgi:chromosome segregation ATPase